ncbi:MAG: hypothetical protein VKS61_02175 [Candidatus Sericytochromatia bacterium]|nr:hypothetical protein [Candidatus Sericytochromatia bacterium]
MVPKAFLWSWWLALCTLGLGISGCQEMLTKPAGSHYVRPELQALLAVMPYPNAVEFERYLDAPEATYLSDKGVTLAVLRLRTSDRPGRVVAYYKQLARARGWTANSPTDANNRPYEKSDSEFGTRMQLLMGDETFTPKGFRTGTLGDLEVEISPDFRVAEPDTAEPSAEATDTSKTWTIYLRATIN